MGGDQGRFQKLVPGPALRHNRQPVTSDTIPAVMFGVPGTVGSAATILDGYPMARKGEAGRAFGAAFTSSVIGGLFGALLLGVSIPILRPIILHIGSPELLSFCIFGLSLASVLSGGSLPERLYGACLPDGPSGSDRHIRYHPGRDVRRARNGRLGRDHPRRLSDGA